MCFDDLIKLAADSYVKKENEEIRKEMSEVEEVFKEMAKECYRKVFESFKT